MKIRTTLILCAAVFALAACSKAPTDAEVEDAVRSRIAADLERARMAMGMAGPKDPKKALDATIVVGEKTKQGDGSFSVIVTVKRPNLPSDTDTVRLLKGADGWVVAEKR